MLDWDKIKQAYEQVKAVKSNGIHSTKIEIPGAKIYSMGEKNPVIRIDIKEHKG